MRYPQLHDEVALLEDYTGQHPQTDELVFLQNGQIGRVVEGRNPEVLIVEFATSTGEVVALASVAIAKLLRIHHDECRRGPRPVHNLD